MKDILKSFVLHTFHITSYKCYGHPCIVKVDLKMFDARYLSKTISAVIFFSLYNNIIMIVIDINIITVNIIIRISRTAPLYVGGRWPVSALQLPQPMRVAEGQLSTVKAILRLIMLYATTE